MLEAHIAKIKHQQLPQKPNEPSDPISLVLVKILVAVLPKRLVNSIAHRMVLPASILSVLPKYKKHPLRKEYAKFYQEKGVTEKAIMKNGISGTLLQKGTGGPTFIFACPNAASQYTMKHNPMVADFFNEHENANIILFDYPGVGTTKGDPLPEEAIRAGVEMYRYAKEELKAQDTRLIGWSYGTFVMPHVAARVNHTGKLTLYQGGTSIVDTAAALEPRLAKVSKRVLIDAGFDQFDTVEILKKLSCPVHIIHTKNDKVFPLGKAALAGSVKESENVKITVLETNHKNSHAQNLIDLGYETTLLF